MANTPLQLTVTSKLNKQVRTECKEEYALDRGIPINTFDIREAVTLTINSADFHSLPNSNARGSPRNVGNSNDPSQPSGSRQPDLGAGAKANDNAESSDDEYTIIVAKVQNKKCRFCKKRAMERAAKRKVAPYCKKTVTMNRLLKKMKRRVHLLRACVTLLRIVCNIN